MIRPFSSRRNPDDVNCRSDRVTCYGDKKIPPRGSSPAAVCRRLRILSKKQRRQHVAYQTLDDDGRQRYHAFFCRIHVYHVAACSFDSVADRIERLRPQRFLKRL